MNKKIKAKWIKALLSGDYKQGTGALKKEDGTYCCLGVLCEIAGAKQLRKQGEMYLFRFKNSIGDEMLPLALRKKLNISSEKEGKLAELNDKGKSFKYIAAYIKRYL